MPELAPGSMPVPATPISELQKWRLDIRCGKCHRHVVLSVESLTKRFDQSARIIEVVRRLKCDGFRCSVSVVAPTQRI
jgi:hypothetical protein